jgi:hypothetical protein
VNFPANQNWLTILTSQTIDAIVSVTKEEFVTNIINISKNQYAGELIKSLQECKPEENYYEILQNFITNKPPFD